MKCGTQPADIRMIHRRIHPSRVAFPVRRQLSYQPNSTFVIAREEDSPSLDGAGHIRKYVFII
jgi:hypothetical protein